MVDGRSIEFTESWQVAKKCPTLVPVDGRRGEGGGEERSREEGMLLMQRKSLGFRVDLIPRAIGVAICFSSST